MYNPLLERLVNQPLTNRLIYFPAKIAYDGEIFGSVVFAGVILPCDMQNRKVWDQNLVGKIII